MGFIKDLKEEINLVRERDPSLRSSIEVLFYPGFHAVQSYKLAHRLYVKRHYILARYISQRTARKTGIEIHPGAVIGKRLFIDHGNGVVIGETAILGNDITLFQGVTLGGTGKEKGKRHPTVGNNVMISAGAKVLGSITIGDNTKIGAGAVVLRDIPQNTTAVGVPARVVKSNNKRVSYRESDIFHIPDSLGEDIRMLQKENQFLLEKIVQLEDQLKVYDKIVDTKQGECSYELGFQKSVCFICK